MTRFKNNDIFRLKTSSGSRMGSHFWINKTGGITLIPPVYNWDEYDTETLHRIHEIQHPVFIAYEQNVILIQIY